MKVELIITKSYLKIRQKITTLTGEKLHEETLSYEEFNEKLPLSMTIESIREDKEGIVLEISAFTVLKRAREKEKTSNVLEVELPDSSFKYHLIYITKNRAMFPGYKMPFLLDTDIGTIETYVTSAPRGTNKGDPEAGLYIQSGLQKWFASHPELKPGDKIRIACLEPFKRYRLDIIR